MSLNPKITGWARQRVWIVGASAGIGAAFAMLLLQQGARVALSARSREPLEILARNFPVDRVRVLPIDVLDVTQIQAAHTVLTNAWGGYDLVIYCAGQYLPQRAWDVSPSTVRQMFAVNVEGVYSCLSVVVPQFITQASGGVAIVSSVAGYSGLPKGLVYGATKAALINLCETLYLDLAPKGIGVFMINPGFVRTRLVAQNDFPMPALMEVEDAASAIMKGLERGQFEIHFPKRFSYVLKFLRHLPYRWYFFLVSKITGP
ncbi:MAG: SDR family NAD(P)-dependent oxidoreductase [Burkholderiales bacterium]